MGTLLHKVICYCYRKVTCLLGCEKKEQQYNKYRRMWSQSCQATIRIGHENIQAFTTQSRHLPRWIQAIELFILPVPPKGTTRNVQVSIQVKNDLRQEMLRKSGVKSGLTWTTAWDKWSEEVNVKTVFFNNTASCPGDCHKAFYTYIHNPTLSNVGYFYMSTWTGATGREQNVLWRNRMWATILTCACPTICLVLISWSIDWLINQSINQFIYFKHIILQKQ